MKIKCSTCKKKTEWLDNPYRPFCSERCKLIDLGAWASGKYMIKTGTEDESGQQPSEEETGNA
jgi:hypothetical protein